MEFNPCVVKLFQLVLQRVPCVCSTLRGDSSAGCDFRHIFADTDRLVCCFNVRQARLHESDDVGVVANREEECLHLFDC